MTLDAGHGLVVVVEGDGLTGQILAIVLANNVRKDCMKRSRLAPAVCRGCHSEELIWELPPCSAVD